VNILYSLPWFFASHLSNWKRIFLSSLFWDRHWNVVNVLNHIMDTVTKKFLTFEKIKILIKSNNFIRYYTLISNIPNVKIYTENWSDMYSYNTF
jgi:hypothetical protein